jgi:hypothetical protein
VLQPWSLLMIISVLLTSQFSMGNYKKLLVLEWLMLSRKLTKRLLQ